MADSGEEALARSAIYELLSASFLYPEDGSAARMSDAARRLALVASERGWGQSQIALRGLSRRAAELDDAAFVDQYAAVFGHTIGVDCAPYEAEYGQAHVFQKAQTLAALNAFYNAFGVSPNPETRDRPDHLSAEMEFMHLLTLKEAYAVRNGHGDQKVDICRRAQRSFLADHLANWIPSFAERLARKALEDSVYASLARLLEAHMQREFGMFRIDSTPLNPVAAPGPIEDGRECCATPPEVGSL